MECKKSKKNRHTIKTKKRGGANSSQSHQSQQSSVNQNNKSKHFYKTVGKSILKSPYYLTKQTYKQRKELFPSLSIGDANCDIGYKMTVTDRNFFNSSKLTSLLDKHRLLKDESSKFVNFFKSNMNLFCNKKNKDESDIKMCITILRCLQEDNLHKLMFDLNRDKSKDCQINRLMIKEKKIAFILFLNNILIPIIKKYNKPRGDAITDNEKEPRGKTKMQGIIEKVFSEIYKEKYRNGININNEIFKEIKQELLEEATVESNEVCCDEKNKDELTLCKADKDCIDGKFPICDGNPKYCRKKPCGEIPKLKIEETEIWKLLSDTETIEKYYDADLFKNELPLNKSESALIEQATGKRCKIDDFECQAVSEKNKGSGTLIYIMFALLGFAAYFNTLPTTTVPAS